MKMIEGLGGLLGLSDPRYPGWLGVAGYAVLRNGLKACSIICPRQDTIRWLHCFLSGSNRSQLAGPFGVSD